MDNHLAEKGHKEDKKEKKSFKGPFSRKEFSFLETLKVKNLRKSHESTSKYSFSHGKKCLSEILLKKHKQHVKNLNEQDILPLDKTASSSALKCDVTSTNKDKHLPSQSLDASTSSTLSKQTNDEDIGQPGGNLNNSEIENISSSRLESRINLPDKFDTKSETELYDLARLRTALKVLRSNLNPGEKLSAIKKSQEILAQIKDDEGYSRWLEKLKSDNTLPDEVSLNADPGLSNEVQHKCSQESANKNNSMFISKRCSSRYDLDVMEKRSPDLLTDSKRKSSASSEIKEEPSDSVIKDDSDIVFEINNSVSKESETSGCSPKKNPDILISSAQICIPDSNELNLQNINKECVEVASSEAQLLSVASSNTAKSSSGRSSPKSPVNIQEWVDSIDLNQHKSEEELPVGLPSVHSSQSASVDATTASAFKSVEIEDTLYLGAEAKHLNGEVHSCSNSFTEEERTKLTECRRRSFLQMKEKQTSFHSDISSVSLSSVSSVETLLESRKEDPEEILLNLGFGGDTKSLDPLARIPKRFLQPSRVKGNNLDEFVRHQEELLETLNSGFCGYRGLSGFLKERCPPIGIVGKLLQKITETDRDKRRSSSPSPHFTSFSEVATSILAANTFLNSLHRIKAEHHSILEPENREFLEKQSDQNTDMPKRIILGDDEYSVDPDGSLILSERIRPTCDKSSLAIETSENIASYIGSPSQDDNQSSDHVNNPIIPNNRTKRLWKLSQFGTHKLNDYNKDITFENSEDKKSKKDSGAFVRQVSFDKHNDYENEDFPHEKDSENIPESISKAKLMENKESFELEEINTNGDDQEGCPSPNGKKELLDLSRLSSALSDSSGFLDGEVSEIIADDHSKLHEEKLANFSSERTLQDLPERIIVKPEPKRPNSQTLSEINSISPLSSSPNKAQEQNFEQNTTKALSNYVFRPITPFEPRNEIELFPSPSLEINSLKVVISDQDNNVVTCEKYSFTENVQSNSHNYSVEEKLDSFNRTRKFFTTLTNIDLNQLANTSTAHDSPSFSVHEDQEFPIPKTSECINSSVFQQCSSTNDFSTSSEITNVNDQNLKECHKIRKDLWTQESLAEEVSLPPSQNKLDHSNEEYDGVIVSPRSSCRSSPVYFNEDSDEYQDLQILLSLISERQPFARISKKEFINKSPAERVQIEAEVLIAALENYRQTLTAEKLTLEHYTSSGINLSHEAEKELQILNQVHDGIYQEISHMQHLLNLRVEEHLKMKNHSSLWIACSVKLIRQISLLLYQQKSLCKQLEKLRIKELDNVNLKNSDVISKKKHSLPSPSSLYKSQSIHHVYRTLEDFQKQIVSDIQEQVRQENVIIKQELQENRKELSEIKKLLLKVVPPDAQKHDST